jgi:hypothetical protein
MTKRRIILTNPAAVRASPTVDTSIPTGIPEDALFHSDWSTALGNGFDAITDSDKDPDWDDSVRPEYMEVVNASTEGLTNWPSTNALKLHSPGGGGSAWARMNPVYAGGASNALGTPGAGNQRYGRIYFQHVTGSDWNNNRQHPLEQNYGGFGGDSNWDFRTFEYGWPLWHLNWYEAQGGDVYGCNTSAATGVLQRNHTYRLEWMEDFITSTTYRMHIRLYDDDDTLLYGDASWLRFGGGSLADNPTFTVNRTDELMALQVGCNGFEGTSVYMYWGMVAFRSNDWCGLYDPVVRF